VTEQIRPNFRYSVLGRSITGKYGVSESHHTNLRRLIQRHLGRMHPDHQVMMKKNYLLPMIPLTESERVQMVNVRKSFVALLSTDEKLEVASWKEE